ncbi:hypothetical protein GYMLUDRAFT_35379 [Collybiopsis luxurians FD-317 M1]|nr:hypothetical protein GYMLUDRAFT_35379 [Collybiopsis luxurians FD-317 M1]
MSLVQLPDDILISILSYSKPPDLVRLRKTCKRLQALTFEWTVWKAAYRHCGYFLPPGPQPSQTVSDLERVLLRAHRWNKIWVQQAQEAVSHSLGCIWSFQTDFKEEVEHMELAYSRYLSVGSLKRVQIYDLETKCEIFRIENEYLQGLEYSRTATAESDATLGFFTPFIKNGTLTFFEISSQGEVKLINTEIPHTTVISIGYNFCIILGRNGSNILSLLHIPSRKVYSLSSSTLVDRGTGDVGATILPGHVLVYEYGLEESCIELFTLPDHATTPAGSPVRCTHSGTFGLSLYQDPLYVSSDISDRDDTGFIWLVGLPQGTRSGIRPFRITLEPEAKMSFYIPDAPTCDPSVSRLFFAEYKVISGSRARGIGYPATFFRRGPEKIWTALYDIYFGSDGDLHADTACVHVPKLLGTCCFDFFVGLIHLREDGIVEVLDLV